MDKLLFLLAMIGMFNSAVWVLCHKWGIITMYQLHRKRWMPVDCNFCFFFWLAFVEFLAIYLKWGFIDLINPIIETPILAMIAAIISLKFKP